MDALKLKAKIIKKIDQINDIETLKSIEILFNLSDKKIQKFLNFATHKSKKGMVSETEDFNDYIKEWVKNM